MLYRWQRGEVFLTSACLQLRCVCQRTDWGEKQKEELNPSASLRFAKFVALMW